MPPVDMAVLNPGGMVSIVEANGKVVPGAPRKKFVHKNELFPLGQHFWPGGVGVPKIKRHHGGRVGNSLRGGKGKNIPSLPAPVIVKVNGGLFKTAHDYQF